MKLSTLSRLAAIGTALILSCTSLFTPSVASATTQTRAAAPAGATVASNYTYRLLRNWHSNLCVSGSSSYGSGKQINCFDTVNHFAQFREIATVGGYVKFVSAFNGACLAVRGAATGDNMPLGAETCTGASHQQFQKVPAPIGGGYFMLVARHSGKCVTILSESLEVGAQIVQYTCSPGSGQIDPIGAGYWNTPPATYIYNRVHNWHSNLCASAYDSSFGYGPKQDACSGSTYQQWMEINSSGYVQLRNAGTGLCATVENASQANNARLALTECAGAFQQQFQKVPAPIGGGYFMLVARHSGKCVTILSESLEVGAQIVQYACSPGQIDPIGAGYWNTV
ncbi:RICIN domain-containing protein [Streptosporangium sp. NPDC049644]|uniref:RICIN domain-containing protein n=1 Tax=Streptosporangium sp. NPDC049644 TaxID=3155507 RepID=UPI00342E5BA4